MRALCTDSNDEPQRASRPFDRRLALRDLITIPVRHLAGYVQVV